MLFYALLFQSLCKLSRIESIDRKEIIFNGDNEVLSQNFIITYASKSDLEKVTIGNGIIEVADYAFNEFKQLHTVILSHSCTCLGMYTFKYCTNLKNLVLQEGLKSIKEGCFFSAGLVNITFPSTYTETPPYFAFYGCNKIQNIFVASNSTVYSSSEDHSMLVKHKSIAVLGYGNSNTIKVPSYIVEIAPYFMNGRNQITTVDFSKAKSLRSIGMNAFRFTSIQRVMLPQGIVNITNIFQEGKSIEYAFFPKTLESFGTFFEVTPEVLEVEEGCKAVKIDRNGIIYDKTGTSMEYLPNGIIEVVIELNVTSVLGASIRNMRSVQSIIVVSNHPIYSSYNNAVYSVDNKMLYFVAGGVKKLEIHTDCQTIEHGAFMRTNIETVDMSKCKNLTTLSHSVFSECRKISVIQLPKTLRNINNYCFYGSSITSIIASPLLSTIGVEAFRECDLKSIDLRECNDLKIISTSAFLRSKINEVFLPPELTHVLGDAFGYCAGLKRIEFPSTMNLLFSGCFVQCSSLSEVIFKGNIIETIPISCFSNCNLSSISLPSSVKYILAGAFSGNTFMTQITFGENSSLVLIQADAFASCDSLTSITLGSKFEILSPGVLSQMKSLTEIIVDAENKNFSAKSGVLYNKNMTVLISFPKGIPEFKIESSVTEIASRAFFECQNLASLEFSEYGNLKIIGSYTFFGCSSLIGLVIPSSVSAINGMAFVECTSIKNVTFLGMSALEEISAGVFEGCEQLRYVIFSRESRLKSVADKAFYGLSSLVDFVAPPSLRVIGTEAFFGCEGITKFDFTNITNIKNSAFRKTHLKDIVLSTNIESIGSDAFCDCEFLQTVSFA